MVIPLNCCCPTQKYTVYVSGSFNDKKLFYQKVFKTEIKDISFSEHFVRFNGTSLILLMISNEENLGDVHKMHMERSNAIIMLRNSDEGIDRNKNTLFIRMNGKSHLESENNVIIRSVINGSFEDAKDGVKALTRLIKK
jgi:hypothetical protein